MLFVAKGCNELSGIQTCSGITWSMVWYSYENRFINDDYSYQKSINATILLFTVINLKDSFITL